jgi:hypothetical protein
MKTLLMATTREGQDVILSGSETSLTSQNDQMKTLFNDGSEKYASVGVFYLTPKQSVKLKLPIHKTEKHSTPMKTKPFKNPVLALLFCFALILPAAAQQRYALVSLVASNSATIAATAGTNVSKVIDVSKQNEVTLRISQMADASGAHTTRYIFARSLDRENWSNMALTHFDISFNGVTQQTVLTNIPTLGVGYLRLNAITNLTATINTTNVIVDYALKVQ